MVSIQTHSVLWHFPFPCVYLFVCNREAEAYLVFKLFLICFLSSLYFHPVCLCLLWPRGSACSRMVKLCGFPCTSDFKKRRFLHVNNEIWLYSANLFPIQGSCFKCRYCPLIWSVFEYLLSEMLYCTLSMVTSLLCDLSVGFFFYIKMTWWFSHFLFLFLVCFFKSVYSAVKA